MSIVYSSGFGVSFTMIQEQLTLYGMLQGQNTSPPVIPTTTVSTTSSKGFMQRSTNWLSPTASDTTRASTGNYTTKLQSFTPTQLPPIIIDVTVNVWGPNGTWATVSDFNPSTGALTFLTFAPGGAAADIVSTEFVHFTFTCQNTTPPK